MSYTPADEVRDLCALDHELRRARLVQEDRIAWLAYAYASRPYRITQNTQSTVKKAS